MWGHRDAGNGVHLPQLGQLRVMAVAVTPERIGIAQTKALVRGARKVQEQIENAVERERA